MVNPAEIGVIGGSGFYSLFDEAEQVELSTPYGPPSDVITVGRIGSRTVAFIPRHGRDHRFPPHGIPYRANLWALRSLGVRQVLAPSAVGSLRAEHGPGVIVIPDQLVDRTTGRKQTFYDVSAAVHVPFADPYCPLGRSAAVATAKASGLDPVDGGTLVVIEGPRFSTRAESRWFSGNGWTIVGMTGHPEAILARELALCYTSISLITDHDAGVESGEGVTQDEVLSVFAANITRMRSLVSDTVQALPTDRTCPCARTLDGIKLPFDLP
ncbi:S-methyl-5'-thioadenosine phosphorylase [Spongiactinospora sp. TRM90649]|uniref:S-methyl-5'-thioadenosine phosphorylase n=1 Tax=Spongiactinospora sp. TRM90649 TaxID=3031114 RepID=UPI0023FA2D9A|nr:S-methyl-5'-thioadenosine phosphorylase [Spongiactinospora sp. TRM90649]MDF5757613.1 S-methyl-5'-thioadenosine phosphorylase [Spongiactinospora sp. TRM90649]